MDDANSYLIVFILTTLVIIAGLGIIIFGMVKKKVKLIALGVFVALLPSMVDFFSSRFL